MTSPPVVRIPVDVPLLDYQPLARIAERRGYKTVGELLAALVVTLVNVRDVDDELEMFVRAGLTDREIAEHTGLVVGTIADRRRRLRLPANRRQRA